MITEVLKWSGYVLVVLIIVLPFILVPVIIGSGRKKKGDTTPAPTTPVPSTSWTKSTMEWFGSKWGFIGKIVLALFTYGVMLATVHEFAKAEWNKFFFDHGQYAYLMVVVGGVVMCGLFLVTKRVAGAGALSTGGGAHKEGGEWKTVLIVLFVLFLLGLAGNTGFWHNKFRNGFGSASGAGTSELRDFYRTVSPYAEEIFSVRESETLDWNIEAENQSIWITSTAEFGSKKWKRGDPKPLIRLIGGGKIGFQSAENGPVVVRITKFPTVRTNSVGTR